MGLGDRLRQWLSSSTPNSPCSRSDNATTTMTIASSSSTVERGIPIDPYGECHRHRPISLYSHTALSNQRHDDKRQLPDVTIGTGFSSVRDITIRHRIPLTNDVYVMADRRRASSATRTPSQSGKANGHLLSTDQHRHPHSTRLSSSKRRQSLNADIHRYSLFNSYFNGSIPTVIPVDHSDHNFNGSIPTVIPVDHSDRNFNGSIPTVIPVPIASIGGQEKESTISSTSEPQLINTDHLPDQKESNEVIVDFTGNDLHIIYRSSTLSNDEQARIVEEHLPLSIVLLNNGRFHSFGESARQFYLALDPFEAPCFLFFDNITASLFNQSIRRDSIITAMNGIRFPLFRLITAVLCFLKNRAMRKLNINKSSFNNPSHSTYSHNHIHENIRWILILGGGGDFPLRQFLRDVAFEIDIASDQLILLSAIDLFAFSCLLNYHNSNFTTINSGYSFVIIETGVDCSTTCQYQITKANSSIEPVIIAKTRPIGAHWSRRCFDTLMCQLFTTEFMAEFKRRYASAWIELMMAFESKLDTVHLHHQPLMLSIPLIFIESFRRQKGMRLEMAIAMIKKNRPGVSWCEQGMLRIEADLVMSMCDEAMSSLLDDIRRALDSAETPPRFLLLAGQWSKSSLFISTIRTGLGRQISIGVVKNEESLCQLAIEMLHRHHHHGSSSPVLAPLCPFTFGVSVLNVYQANVHPAEKRIMKNNVQWCRDIFDRLILRGYGNQRAIRRYSPASIRQTEMLITFFRSETDSPLFVTEQGVSECGRLRLDVSSIQEHTKTREIEVIVEYVNGDLTVNALDLFSGKVINAQLDFLQ